MKRESSEVWTVIVNFIQEGGQKGLINQASSAYSNFFRNTQTKTGSAILEKVDESPGRTSRDSPLRKLPYNK